MGLLLAVHVLLLLAFRIGAQCNGPSITITSNADAELISSCSTYNGDIVISPSTAVEISLNNLESVSGNLSVVDSSFITSLSASQLTTIGGIFELRSLPRLTGINFQSLSSASRVRWEYLPALQGLDFEAGLDEVSTIYISDVALQNLQGFVPTVLTSLEVYNCQNMETANFNELENVTEILSFQNNAPWITVHFPSLQFVFGNITFHNISGLSTPDLQNVTGTFECHSCSMETYRSTWLQTVGMGLSFVSTDLQSLDFPDLIEIVGDLQLSNNSKLRTINGFPVLEDIQGGILINGNFDSISLDSLGLVEGDVIVETTSSNTTICDLFNGFKHEQTIRGQLACQLSVSESQATSTNLTLNGTTSTSDAARDAGVLPGGAIAGIVLGILTTLSLISVGAFFFVRMRKSRGRHNTTGLLSPLGGIPEFPQNGSNEKAELYADSRKPQEMSAGSEHPDAWKARTISGVHEAADYRIHASEMGDTSPLSQSSPVIPIRNFPVSDDTNSSSSAMGAREGSNDSGET